MPQLPSILYSTLMKYPQDSVMHRQIIFFRTCYMLSERLFELVSEPSGSSRWKCQDPPLVIFHTEHHVFSFPPGIFWLSKFTYHISASLQWYQICWITGLGYCIIYFALIEVLVWRPGFPSCIGTSCLFLSSWSLPLECKVSIDSASYIYDMFR